LRLQPNSIVIGLALLAVMIPAGAAESLSAGQMNYMLQCQGCHKASGIGSGGSVPDLHDYGRQFLSVSTGRQFYVSVPGSAKSPLSDSELAEVLNFIMTDILGDEPERPDSLVRFTDKEISQYRSIEIVDVKSLREELVEEITENSAVEKEGGTGER
jgi:mono/diheme cytochrome c family protein